MSLEQCEVKRCGHHDTTKTGNCGVSKPFSCPVNSHVIAITKERDKLKEQATCSLTYFEHEAFKLKQDLALTKRALELACESECNVRSKYEHECLACSVEGKMITSSNLTHCHQLLINVYTDLAKEEKKDMQKLELGRHSMTRIDIDKIQYPFAKYDYYYELDVDNTDKTNNQPLPVDKPVMYKGEKCYFLSVKREHDPGANIDRSIVTLGVLI